MKGVKTWIMGGKMKRERMGEREMEMEMEDGRRGEEEEEEEGGERELPGCSRSPAPLHAHTYIHTYSTA